MVVSESGDLRPSPYVTVREDVRDSQGCSHALLRTLSKQTPASGSYFLQVGYEPVCLKSRTLRTEQRLPLARQSRTLVLRAGYPVARTLFRPKHRWIRISSSDSTSSEEIFTQPSRRRERTLTCDFVIILEPFVLYLRVTCVLLVISFLHLSSACRIHHGRQSRPNPTRI